MSATPDDDGAELIVLRADPAGARPSPIEGMSLDEFDEIAANIRWFSALTLDEKLSLVYRARRLATSVSAECPQPSARERDGR